jgi:DNA-binding NtrC family response regulator
MRAPRILCVDDEPEVLDLLSQYLAGHGFAVRTARSVREAVLEAKRWMPKALIADLVMPRHGGLDAVDRVREINPGVVVVLISGRPDLLRAASAAGLCVAGAFPKPLDLRRMRDALVEAGVVPVRPSREAGAGPVGQPRVLVVDDDREVREILAEYVRRRGFAVIEAGRGEEALTHVGTSGADIVLLDISMPGLGGVETLKRIRAGASGTPVVMITANSDVRLAQHTLALGAVDYLAKPVDFGYLDAVLDTYAGRRAGG